MLLALRFDLDERAEIFFREKKKNFFFSLSVLHYLFITLQTMLKMRNGAFGWDFDYANSRDGKKYMFLYET